MDSDTTAGTDPADIDAGDPSRPSLRISVQVGSPHQGRIVRAFAMLLRLADRKPDFAEIVPTLLARMDREKTDEQTAPIETKRPDPIQKNGPAKAQGGAAASSPANPYARRRLRRMTNNDIAAQRIEPAETPPKTPDR